MTTTIPPAPSDPTFQTFGPAVTAADFAIYEHGWLDREAALLKRIAELENPPAPVPTPTSSFQFGTNIGTNAAGNDPNSGITRVEAKVGPLGAVRFFFSAGKGIHWPTSAELGGDLGQRILNLNAKLLPQDVLAGKYDDEIKRTVGAIPAGNKALLTCWHEPGSEVYAPKPTFTAAQYRDAQAHFAALVHGEGNPNALVDLCIEDYTWNGHAGRNWHDLYAGKGTADVFSTDGYAWGPSNPADFSTLFAGVSAAAKEAGVLCCVTETGADPATFGTGQALLDAWTKLGQRVKAVTTGPVAMTFGSMPGDRWDATSDPRRLAAFRAALGA